jgi:hypothetical protein
MKAESSIVSVWGRAAAAVSLFWRHAVARSLFRFSVRTPVALAAVIVCGGAVCSAAVSAADASPRAAVSRCDRSCLVGFANRYLDALLKHDPTGLPLANNYKFTENGQRLRLGQGLWHQASDIQYRQYFADPARGEVVFDGALEESGLPTLLMLRLRIVNRKISEIETIVKYLSISLDGAVATLQASQPVIDSILPMSERSSRQTLEAIANTYLDGLQDHPPKPFPVTGDCSRTEDGRTTSRTASNAPPGWPTGCDLNTPIFDYMTSVHDRRFFVTDVKRGQAFVIAIIDCPGTLKYMTIDGKTTLRGPGQRRPRDVLVGVVFKIIGGKLARLQAFHRTDLPIGIRSGW